MASDGVLNFESTSQGLGAILKTLFASKQELKQKNPEKVELIEMF